MKILLVGATGTLGRQIAKQAIEDGHEVRCFVRNPRKASFLQEWGCELTKGNLLNSSDIEYALQDIEVVIDAATSKPDDPKSIYEIDWDGKVNLFNACESLNFTMAKEIVSIAAVFWILIRIGVVGGALLLKFQGD